MSDSFPVFRQLGDLQVLYKIIDDRNFIEYRKVGSKWIIHEVIATQFPEIMRIRDMISLEKPFLELCQEDFYQMINHYQ